jgi:[acyl-carrier-protein] S-malonyltransferase
MNSLVFLFPGQGSQYVGMGKSLHDAHESVRRLFDEASDATGKDLRTLCFEGPETVLVQTENVQPAITLVSLAALHVLREEGIEPSAAAGHSVGEYAALCAAGALSFADAMHLVRIRGAAMQAEATRHPGSMAAVFGLSADVLVAICAETDPDAVRVANHNAPDQVVLTGTSDAVRQAGQTAKARGAKLVIPLKVSGPWHSPFMAGAQEPLARALDQCPISAPRLPVMANLTGAPYASDGRDIRDALVAQIVSPVLWTQCLSALVERGSRTFVEVGPGRVLSGLLKSMSRDLQIANVQDAETLAAFRAAT